MLAFVLKRLAMLAGTLLVSSFAIYGALYLAPGSPIAALTGGRTVPPDVMAQLQARYHLDEPFLSRYWIWLTSALRGDLGESIPLHENVSTLIGQRIGVTLSLVASPPRSSWSSGLDSAFSVPSVAAGSTPGCCSPRPCRPRFPPSRRP